jgi:hypothetical protein
MSVAASLYAAVNGPSWDDLRTPATSIPIRGQSGDPDADDDGSLLFDASTAEQVALLFQLPHSWQHGTGVRFHVHWAKSTDAAGDVVWEYRYRRWANNAIAPAWSDWIAATTRSQTIAADQTTLIDGWPELSMTGLLGSCLLSIQLRRNPDAETDTYAADARLYDADCHYRAYGLGSPQEYPS